MRTLLIASALMVTAAVRAGACQGAAEPEAAAKPAHVMFEHDGQNVTGFAIYIQRDGGAPLRMDLGALTPATGGRYTVPLPPLTDGSYRVEMAAYNAAGESPRIPAEPERFTASNGVPAPNITAERGGLAGRIWKIIVGDDKKP